MKEAANLPLVRSIFSKYLNKWRLVLLIFLVVYAVLLSMDLSYMALQWDEMPHLYGGLLLSRGQFHDYVGVGSFYPPFFDVATALYFRVLSESVFSGRLVAVTFSVLSIWAVFEYAYRLRGPGNAFLASVLLASMPGFIWISRTALIETMLVFFFSVSLFLFFFGMQTKNNRLLFFSGLALGLGFLVKYQVLISGLVMLVSFFTVWRERILSRFRQFSLVVVVAGVIALAWICILSRSYPSGSLSNWLYAIQVGNEERVAYSTRFPVPIFYLVEMTSVYDYLHPISLPIYCIALLGLGLWTWRRKRGDLFSLTFFFVVYIVFTLIPNRNWRYIVILFPILALSASDFASSLWDRAKSAFGNRKVNLPRIDVNNFVAAVFIFLIGALVVYSSWDAYSWVRRDSFHVPTEEATQYVAEHSSLNDTLVVLCPTNLFNVEMMKFYLEKFNLGQRIIWQYPELPVDAYPIVLNASRLIEQSETLRAKHLLLYEYKGYRFFDSELTYHEVSEILYSTGRFAEETWFGESPNRIFIISFFSN